MLKPEIRATSLAEIAAEVMIDPIGAIITSVAAADPGLPSETTRDVVERVGGGRAKRRRLAAALLENPSVLTTGLSPAPTVVGELLLGLRAAGATRIAAPRCAGCDREVSSVPRRGDGWFCSPCFKRPETCAACGNERQVSSRDRNGQPRCAGCRDHDSDPITALIELVTSLDPTRTADSVAAAVGKVVIKGAHVQKLAWAVQANPDLLTGDGAHAPFPMILHLIDALVEAGASIVRRPECPRCGRIVTLSKRVWTASEFAAAAEHVPPLSRARDAATFVSPPPATATVARSARLAW